MADPQFVDLQDEVLSRDYGSAIDRTNAKLWINAANRDVHGAFRWTWAEDIATLTATAGVETIAVPATLLWVGRFRPGNATTPKVEYIDPGNINPNSPLASFNPTASGQRGGPRYVTRFGDNFYFDPTPDAAYVWTLYFWKMATILTADADEPNIPEDDREILVYGALVRAAERDRDINMAQYWKGEYLRKLDDMRTKDSFLTQSPRRVPMPKSYYGRYDRGR